MQIATPVSPSATGPTIQQTLWDQRHAEQQQWKFEPQLPAVGAPANDGVLHMSSSGSPFKPQLSATHASDSAAAPVLMRSPIPGFRPLSASAVSRPQSATRASALGTFTPPYTAHKRLRKRPVELEVGTSQTMAVREEAITDLGIEVADDLNIGKRTDVSVWPATASKSERGAKSALLLEMQQKLNASLSQIRQREEQGEEVDMHAQWRPYREVFQLFISRSTEYNDILTKVNKKVDEILRQYKFSKGRLAVHADKMEEVRTEMQQKADQMKTQYVKKITELQSEMEKMTETNKRLEALVQKQQKKIFEQQATIATTEETIQTLRDDKKRLLVDLNSNSYVVKDLNNRFTRVQNENDSLMKVVDANSDLWRELDATRKTVEQVKQDHGDELAAMRATITQEQDNHEATRQMMRNAQRVCRRQVEEIQRLEIANASLHAKLREATDHRDAVIQTHTPRPAWASLQQDYSAVFLALDKQKVTRTRDEVEALLQFADERELKVHKLTKKMAAVQKLVDFLDMEDLEKAGAEVVFPPPGKYFVGLGTHQGVPMYMRWMGKIRNLQLQKTDVDELMYDFWTERWASTSTVSRAKEGEQPASPKKQQDKTIQEFFLSFLAKRYGTQAAVMEMVYNVMHSLKGLQTETVYEIFYRILTGDYHESVHRSLYKSIAGLRHALVQLDKATMTRHRKHGVVKLRLVTDLINRIFGTKSDAEVIRIRYAISRDMKTMHAMRNQVHQNTDEVMYEALFPPSIEAEKGFDFIKVLRDQHVAAIDELRTSLNEALAHCASSDGTITPYILREALRYVDQGKPENATWDVLRHVWPAVAEDNVKALQRDVYQVMDALKGVLLVRSAKPPPAGGPNPRGLKRLLLQRQEEAKVTGDENADSTSDSDSESDAATPATQPNVAAPATSAAGANERGTEPDLDAEVDSAEPHSVDSPAVVQPLVHPLALPPPEAAP